MGPYNKDLQDFVMNIQAKFLHIIHLFWFAESKKKKNLSLRLIKCRFL